MKALLARIPWLRIGLFLAALCVLQLFRWHIVTGGGDTMIVYRLDRLTGRVEMSLGAQEWQRIESPRVNSWGDREVRP